MKHKLSELRGEFILKSIEMELSLDFVLEKIYNRKNETPFKLILKELPFEKKINILATITKNKQFNKSGILPEPLENLIKDNIQRMREIKNVRNFFAHYHIEHPLSDDHSSRDGKPVFIPNEDETAIEIYKSDGEIKLMTTVEVLELMEKSEEVRLQLFGLANVLH